MANNFELIEGFDHVGSSATDMARLDDKSTGGSGGWIDGLSDTNEILPTTGRDSQGLALRMTGAGSGQNAAYAFDNTLDDLNGLAVLVGGFAFRLGFQPCESSSRTVLMGFATPTSAVKASINVTRGGGIAVSGGSGYLPTNRMLIYPTTIEHSPVFIRENVWHYLTFIFNIGQNSISGDSRSGGWHIWVDRQLAFQMDPGGRQTWDSAASLGQIALNRNTSTGTIDFDDMWFVGMSDKTDAVSVNPGVNKYSVLANLVRDPQVRAFFPAADGANENWTPDTGIDNADRVDDNPDDGDTSYIEATASAVRDTYTYAAVDADAYRIPMVAVSATVKEQVATVPNLKFRTRHSTNEQAFGAEVIAGVSSYEVKQARVRRDVGSVPSNIPVTMTNAGAESGSLTGWTAAGDLTSAAGVETTPLIAETGSWYFAFDNEAAGGGNEEGLLYQDVATSTDSIPTSDIDNGNLQVVWGGYINGAVSSTDEGVLKVSFRDANGDEIVEFSQEHPNPIFGWVQDTLTCHIPPGTRTIRYIFGGISDGVGIVQIYWDTMSATVQYLDDTDEFTPTQIDAAEFGPETA
jgi:hypothetical protein